MAEESNIGASRLLGTNGLQQAVDSLSTQVTKLTETVGKAANSFSNMSGASGRSSGGSTTGNNWNTTSNRNNYSSNGGGGSFSSKVMSLASTNGGGGNGGGGRFSMSGGSAAGGSKFAGAVAVGAGVAAGLTNYGNQNMSTNMQMDMFNAYSNVAGGGNSMTARHMVFDNNNLALDVNDAAQAAYTNAFTFGNAQFGGQANPAFQRGMAQTQGFGYASPTLGANAAAQAAQQTYSPRSQVMSQVLGLRAPIGPGGVKNSMSSIAQSIYTQTFGNKAVSQKGFNASISQGGSLAVNLQYMGQQMGWNQTTIQEYQNYLQGMNAAQNNGMSVSQYDTLSQQASQGNKNAINKLSQTTSLGSSMFENQRNLSASRVTRQSDILDTLAPAFDNATQKVNDFSNALTNFLKTTHLDSAVGSGGGWGSALSGGMGGLSSGFGMGSGLLTAARLFKGGGGGVMGLLGRGGGGGALSAARGISGLGAAGGGGLLGGSAIGLGAVGTALAGYFGWQSATQSGGVADFMAKHASAFGVFGQAAGLGQGAHRWYDKLITGKDKESFWDLFAPGQEKRTTTTDGRNGGGSNATPGGGGVGTSSSGGSANTGTNAAQIIKFAESQLGVPYLWGGESPGKGMDCSGLVQWAFGKAGVKLPRTSEEQQKVGSSVAINNTQPGDLLFAGNPAHHVAIALGNGQLIEAPHSGANVRIRSYGASEFTSASRVVNTIGNTGDLLNNNSSGNTNTLNNQQRTSGGNIGAYAGTSEAAAIASALAGSIASMPISSGSKSAGGTSGTTPVGSNPQGNGQNDQASLQAYAKQLLSQYGWGDQWNSFNALVMSESSWDVHAKNSSSGAYGLAQALPASKYGSAGSDWQSNGDTQLQWMMGYIKERYTNPNNAWSFHQKNNWYDTGAWSIDKDQKAVVHQGEMIIPAQQAETIRQVLLNNSFNPNNNKSNSGHGLVISNISVQMPNGYSGSAQEAKMTGKMVVDAIVSDTRIKNLQKGQ
jgi:cell wall-associated NlpC family hydrolase